MHSVGVARVLGSLERLPNREYAGLDFLDLLRSGEKDILAFADRRQRQRLGSNSSVAVKPTGPERLTSARREVEWER